MGDEVSIARPGFCVRAGPSLSHVTVELSSFRQPLRPVVSVDTLAEFDRSVSVAWAGIYRGNDHDRLSWDEKSTLWSKRYHLDVHADHIEFHAEVRGEGRVDSIRFFDAIEATGFVPHFALTKHFNDKTQTGARAYSTGSPTAFTRVFCPEPNSYARQEFRPYEYAQVSVNADLDYCGGNFIANPGLFCFAVSADPGREWLTFGLAVDPGEHHFSEYEYLGGDDFALNLNCWGAPRICGYYRTPRMVMVSGVTAKDAVAKYVRVLRDSGLVPGISREQATWWQRPIVCGWGHQCYQADLFRIRSPPERPADNAAYMLSTQTNYRDLVERFDASDLPWGTLIIDARWFQAGGLKNVDAGRWPDLRGFIDMLHRDGKRVLLWWGPWDPDGISADQCVRFLPADGPGRQNRPGRLAKFGAPAPGRKLAVDITLPEVQLRIREQIRVLLGEFGADGLKVDHLSAAPGIYGMAFPDASSGLFGVEAAYKCMALLYETAKDVKPDALIIGQSPNPYFADVQDMLRLGDVYAHRQDSVAAEMSFRAEMARAADPSWLIDADGWPMPSLTAFREYVEVQPGLGVPSLYYATHLDTTGEALTEADFALIRRAWSR